MYKLYGYSFDVVGYLGALLHKILQITLIYNR